MQTVNRLNARVVATLSAGKDNNGTRLWLDKRENDGIPWSLLC
ncbi:DUF4102 domain-containing protein [Bartonella sp. A05]|nr:DUF4102 domain-containing protein [Bartonella sp. A05]MCZ2203653.1 DUF4102 domain-containing protein [Bartonella sp. A05]